MAQPKNGPYTIFIVSDATGETAYRVVRAALAQYKDILVEIKWRQGTRTAEQVSTIVEEAAALNGMIVHTLVDPDLRQRLMDESRGRATECIDLIGPVLLHFSDWLGRVPAQQPGLTQQIDEDYFRRITAIEFAVQHDDGRNAHELDQADLVLVGVSRTSKTPLSMYFATRGWLVGNVPLVPGIEPPPILFELPRQRVVALTVRPERLISLRGARQRALGVSGRYGDEDSIREELRYARQVFMRGGWPVVDMSVKSIEEAASEILAMARQEMSEAQNNRNAENLDNPSSAVVSPNNAEM